MCIFIMRIKDKAKKRKTKHETKKNEKDKRKKHYTDLFGLVTEEFKDSHDDLFMSLKDFC